jgi:virginiamycin A acetyltransferase
MPGVRIGHGAIIASGAIVVDDVPDYGIVGGNPAQLIRARYSDPDITRLLALAWWDWPADHLARHLRAGAAEEVPAVGVRPGFRCHCVTECHPV